MAKLTRAKRRAENKAKQEKLERERAEQKDRAAQPPLPPVALAEAQKEIQAPQANATTSEQGDDKRRNRPQATHAEWAVAACTAALCILAIVQGTAMIVQNNIMREQMRQTEATIDIMRQQQRADFFIGAPEISELVADAPIAFAFTITNVGGSTGTIKHMTYGIGSVEEGMSANEAASLMSQVDQISASTGPSFVEIARGVERPFMQTYKERFSKEQIAKFNTGTSVPYMVIRITYSDSFGGTKLMRRCFTYDRKYKIFRVDESNHHDEWLTGPPKNIAE